MLVLEVFFCTFHLEDHQLRPANGLGREKSYSPVCCFPLPHVLFFLSFWHSLQNSLQEFLLVGDFSLNRPVSLINFTHLIPNCKWHHHDNTKTRNRQHFLRCRISHIFLSESPFGWDGEFLFSILLWVLLTWRPAVKEGLLVLNSLPQRLSWILMLLLSAC